MSPEDARGAVTTVVRKVDARKWKELQELLYRNRNSEKRRNENEEK